MSTDQYAHLRDRYPNAGNPWTNLERNRLRYQTRYKFLLLDVCAAHGRTPGAIWAECCRLFGEKSPTTLEVQSQMFELAPSPKTETTPMNDSQSDHYFRVHNATGMKSGVHYKTLKEAKAAALQQAEATGNSATVYEIRKVGTAGPIVPKVQWRAGK